MAIAVAETAAMIANLKLCLVFPLIGPMQLSLPVLTIAGY
jgi:hypothetical protein